MSTVMRALGWTISSLLVLVFLASLYYVYPVLRDPLPEFMPRKGELVESRPGRVWQLEGARIEEITLVSSSGLQVEISIRRPARVDSPLPGVVLLGGLRTGRDAATLLPASSPAVIVALSYPCTGDLDMKGFGLLRNIPHVQQCLRDVTPALMLTLDYLLQQPYSDPRQVELVGVSLGAFLVPIAGAVDARISRVWLVQGAGDPTSLYADRMRNAVQWDWWRDTLAGALALVTDVQHLSPERWVGRISPRPVIVINSRQDSAFPPANVQTLHEALREPYEIIWLEGEHVRPSRQNVVRQLSDIVLTRILQDRPVPKGRTLRSGVTGPG